MAFEMDTDMLEFMQKLLKDSGDAADALQERMLEAGAQVVKAEQVSQLRSMKKIAPTGELVASVAVRADKDKDGDPVKVVGPVGQRDYGTPKKGVKGSVRNAQIAFMLEFGANSMPKRPWMSVAREKAKDGVMQAMQKVWDRHHKKLMAQSAGTQ